MDLHEEIHQKSILLYEMEDDGMGGSPEWIVMAHEIEELERIAEDLDRS